MRVGLFFLSLFCFFSARPTEACNQINSANEHLQARLEARDKVQDKLDEELNRETTRCQNESSKISAKTAQLAGAQSCIALQESAAFNRELKSISLACADKIDGIRIAMEFVRSSDFQPFQSSIDIVVQEDQGDSFLQSICSGQLQDTSGVLERTNSLMSRSKKGIAKASTDWDKFAKLWGTVAGFEVTTQGGWDRCVAEGKILDSRPVASGAPTTPIPVPQGTPERDGNTITGIEQENAKRAREREILGF